MTDGAGRPGQVPPWQGDKPVSTLSTRPDVEYDPDGALRRFLANGEHLLGLVDMKIAPGRQNVETAPDGRSPGRRAAERAVSVAAGGGSPSLNSMLGVESARGRAGTWADRVLTATWMDRGKPSHPHYLFVSDQRLVLAGQRIGGDNAGYRAAMELPRDAVADVRLVPKPLVRGRVVIDFTDGSMVALKYGTWRAGVARRVVDVVEQWRRQSASR
jgi:hypothetical protein